MVNVCYFCGEPAVSDDHCPPKVFFPERKDLPPEVPDLRVNLVTVPSCKQHNADFAMDDEYAAFIMAHLATNNKLAEHFVLSKVLRAVKRNPRLFSTLYLNPREHADGEHVAFTADVGRLQRVVDRIVRGLHFHHAGHRLPSRPTSWLFLGLRDSETGELHPEHVRMQEAADKIARSGEVPVVSGYVGSPLIFRYELMGGPERGLYRLRFYEGFVAMGSNRVTPE